MDVAKVAKAVVTPAEEGVRPDPRAAPQIIVVPVPTPAPELDSLRKSLAAADDEIERARPDRDLLERLNAHLEGIRGDMSARDARTEAEAAAAREAVGRRQRAIDALADAERRLATGDSQVVDTLDNAVPALPFPAQEAARNARTAVESEDLYRARWWIRLAIVQAQATFLRN